MAIKSWTTAAHGRQRLQNEAERLYRLLRRDAEALLARGRRELTNDVRGLQRRTNRAARDFEASVLKRVHAVSDADLRRLERRVAMLERRVGKVEGLGHPSVDRGAA
jgi:vacuolar-type H+-ATPase subunit E/Vma4